MGIDRFLIVTNIPTPYRTFLYNAFHHLLHERGMGLKVYYLGETEHDRSWNFDRSAVKYDFEICKGLHLKQAPFKHVNPALPLHFRNLQNTVLMVCGYDNFATLMLSLLPQAPSSLKLLWSESNLIKARSNRFWTNFLKTTAISRYDGYIVPGEWAVKYLLAYGAKSGDSFVLLPNTIDEACFSKSLDPAEKRTFKERLGIPPRRKVALIAARLEWYKNVSFTLRNLPDLFWRECSVVVAGNGTEFEGLNTLSKALAERELGPVRLLGQVASSDMPLYYRLADFFMLPSIQDASPLSCVEALYSGLPLVLSDRVGNHPEVLQIGMNGWLFDATKADEVVRIGTNLAAISVDDLRRMGECSSHIFASRFSTMACARRALDQIFSVYGFKNAGSS